MSKIRIGILLYFDPLPSDHDMSGEGIARVINEVINGISQSDEAEICVVTPGWCAPSVKSMFAQSPSLPNTSLKFTSMKSPNWFRVRGRYYHIHEVIRPWLDRIPSVRPLTRTLRFRSILASGLIGAAIGILCATKLSVNPTDQALPLVLVPALACALGSILVVGAIAALVYRIPHWVAVPGSMIEEWFLSHRTQLLADARQSFVRDVEKIDVDVCWIPTLTLPEAWALKKPWVFTFPDMVFREFPTQWTWLDNAPLKLETTKKLLQTATRVTTYSKWVAENQADPIREGIGGPISVIRNGPISLKESLPGSVRSELASYVLSEMKERSLPPWTTDWDWANGTFIFAPTQNRPHKNFVTLFKAIDYLNRKRFANLRLVLTASSLADSGTGVDLAHLRTLRGLEHQIIEVPRVSAIGLAALTKLASLVISPALFEAGVPFMLAEGTSVNSPVILAANQVTCAEIDWIPGHQELLFDPYDFMSLADRIESALSNAEGHLRNQKQVMDSYYENATWIESASRYLDVFRKATQSTDT